MYQFPHCFKDKVVAYGRKHAQEIIKQQEKQIKQYEELLMAISKENREIREREDLLFHDSPDFIEMTERIKWFSSLNSFNEKA